MEPKVFTYEVDGLTYTVTVYEDTNGQVFADVTVLEGAMDVNAIYYGDEDFSGSSENLGGPLNMNGSKLDGEKVQWDGATAVSDPGLGSEGEGKESFLMAGDTLTIELEEGVSLDDIDVIGIRATSTTTDEGSIKGVSDEPETPPEEEDPLYEKVFFGENIGENGELLGGVFILSEPDPDSPVTNALPEGTDPTFENYLDYYLNDVPWTDITNVQSVVFFSNDEDGNLVEEFRVDPPEGQTNFSSAEELLTAYDAAIEAQMGTLSGADLIAALTLDPTDEQAAPVEAIDDDMDDALDII